MSRITSWSSSCWSEGSAIRRTSLARSRSTSFVIGIPAWWKEPGLGTTDEISFGIREPARLDVKRQEQGFRAPTVHIFMLLPGIDGDQRVAAQRHRPPLDHEVLVGATDLEDQVAMGMGMVHQRCPCRGGRRVQSGPAGCSKPWSRLTSPTGRCPNCDPGRKDNPDFRRRVCVGRQKIIRTDKLPSAGRSLPGRRAVRCRSRSKRRFAPASKYREGEITMDVVFQDQARDRREQERQRKFRDRFVAETPPWYHGALHLAFTLLVTGAAMRLCWQPNPERRLGMATGDPIRARSAIGSSGPRIATSCIAR